MKTRVERTRAKHQELTALFGRLMARREKTIEALVRIEIKATAMKRAIARSQKRLDKQTIEAAANAGPVDRMTAPPIADRGATAPPPPSSATTTTTDDGLDIPAMFRRVPNAADDAAKAEIAAQQAGRKTAKAHGRVAKLKANQSGERRKMPLQGKAALDAIDSLS